MTFQTYLITPVGLNEIQLQSGKVIKPSHSPIIIEEECEQPGRDVGGSEMATAATTTDIEEVVTSVTTNPRSTVTIVTTNSGKDDTPVTTDLTVVTQDPPYP